MEDSEGQSLQLIRPSELYPKPTLVAEDDKLIEPFSPICGEFVAYLGQSTNGTLALSNYRLYHKGSDKNSFYNIPLGLIEQIEVKDINNLHIACKDGRYCRLTFLNSDVCLEWMRRLTKATLPPKSKDDLFAFALYAWASEEPPDAATLKLSKESPNNAADNFKNEVKRLEFDTSETGPWRISSANSKFGLCSSYPRHVLVPASVTDEKLDLAAKFRSTRRVPAVVWRHRQNGAVIARCSQPEVGWLGWRSSEDEELLKAIADACVASNESSSKKLLIMDARSYATAVANRARGGGCECPEYYPNCDIQFMNLANIHAVRKSFAQLRGICCPTDDHPNWFSLLESTRWLHNIAGILHAAVTVAQAVEVQGRPVLVHCSDGWDRTPQIVSLAQLLLDPYYRTIEGFRVLVEREWLEFGHKFADRCGLADDANERCPVFLQWLDCIHSLVKRYPCHFEFNSLYLVKLAQHTYSNMFGTFLCNNIRERSELNVATRTFSVWTLLKTSDYVSHLYSKKDEILWPSCNIRDLELWRELYLGGSCPSDIMLSTQQHNFAHNQHDNNANVAAEFMNGEDLNGNGEEQNGHVEDFNLKKIAELKCENEEAKTVDLPGDVLGRKWENEYSEVLNYVKQETKESVINRNEFCKSSQVTEFDSSVESSTQTIVSTNDLAVFPDITYSLDMPAGSPSGSGDLDPIDGLTILKDDVQQRVTEIVSEKQLLERELAHTRKARYICFRCNNPQSPPERQDEDGSVCSTDVSWEAVEEQDTYPTLWVPDHAASHCMGCNSQFWLGRRKHHCRSCGKVFCADCSENTVPLPEEQLYEPVRVCAKCFSTPPNSPQANSCNQAPTLLSRA